MAEEGTSSAFCHHCGQKLQALFKFCPKCGKAILRAGEREGDSRSPNLPKFAEYMQKKEKDRQSFFIRNKPAAKKIKSEEKEVSIQVGIINENGKAKRGGNLPVKVMPSATAKEILSAAIKKHAAFNADFDESRQYILAFKDGVEITCVPGIPNEEFTLQKFKEESGFTYARIVFYLRVCENDQSSSDSDRDLETSSWKPKSSASALNANESASTALYKTYISLIDTDDDDDDEMQKEEEALNQAIMASLEESHHNENNKDTSKRLVQIIREHQAETMVHYAQNHIIVRRAQLLKTAFAAINLETFNSSMELKVQFSGEEASDAGGPRREFFRLVMKELAYRSGLFEGEDGQFLFKHDIKLLEQNKYFLAGRLVGMSITQEGPGLCCLDPHLYMMMCGLPCNLDDFDVNVIDDKEFLTTVQQLKTLKSNEDMMEFVESRGDYVARQGYSSIYLAKFDQQASIIQALVKYYIKYRVSAEIEQFTKGINDVGNLWEKVKRNPTEFKPLFTLSKSPLTGDAFKAICKIDWSPEGSNYRAAEDATIYCWDVFVKNVEDGKVKMPSIEESTYISLKDILQFMTGADAIPTVGFMSPLTITFYNRDAGKMRLPYASTCALEIALPRGLEDPLEFERLMIRSILESCGFGKV